MAINGFLTTRGVCAAIFMAALLTSATCATGRVAEAGATPSGHANVRMARHPHRGLTDRDATHAVQDRCARIPALAATMRGYSARPSSRHPGPLAMGGMPPGRIRLVDTSAVRDAAHGQAGASDHAGVITGDSVHALATAALATPLVPPAPIGDDEWGGSESAERSDCAVAGTRSDAQTCIRASVVPSPAHRRFRGSISAEYP